MSMAHAETARRVLHKHNYEHRLCWNAVEICDLAMSAAKDVSEDGRALDLLESKIANAIAARKNEQRAALPEESAKWWTELS